MTLDFVDTKKIEKNMTNGMTYRPEEVLDWMVNVSDPDKGDTLSENEIKDDICSQKVILTICPPPENRWK